MMHRGVQLALAVGIVGVAGAVIVLPRLRASTPTPPRPSAMSEHAAGIDRAMAAVLALYEAPEGKTPCETAYNGYKASLDVSTEQGVKAAVLRLSPRDEFLAGCAALPSAAQQCLVRRYAAQHQKQCDKSVFTDDVNAQLAKIVETVHATEPVREPPVIQTP
jgi:hypothetical protein